MITFLKKVGIEDAVIKDLEQIYSEANLFNLNSHEYEVIKIIKYFKKIGIEYIDELLVETNAMKIQVKREDYELRRYKNNRCTRWNWS